MQKKIIIFLFSLNIILLNFTHRMQAQPVKEVLRVADSMYQQKKYKEAEEMYSTLLFEKQHYTLSMLLKLVQLHELKSKSNSMTSLYALSLYYAQSPNRNILQRIHSIVDKKNLKGYEITDWQYIISFYRHYKIYLVMAVVLLFIAGTFYLYRHKKQQKNPTKKALALGVSIILFLILHNYILSYHQGIVYQRSLLMSAPSAGSTCMNIVPIGDCFQILDQKDVWCKVRYKKENMEGYIRSSNLLMLN